MSFFDFKDVPNVEIMPGFNARFHHSEQLTFGPVTIEAGAELPEHSHVNEQFTKVLEGRLEFTIAGETKILEAGMVAHMPPHTPHSAKALTRCRVFDCFYPFREDLKQMLP